MFHVGSLHLESAFFRHRDAGKSDPSTDSHLLLMIYAAECGLKRLLLKSLSLHTTARLSEDDLTHDLDELLRKLGSRERFGDYAADPGQASIRSGRIHEVLRYGGRFGAKERSEILSRARAVIEWIEESL